MTQQASENDPALAKFLQDYQTPNCFYDWGDDPSFFASSQVLGDARALSWGVCRRDVRAVLGKGDFVAWFCAKQTQGKRDEWRYYFVGCSTVSQAISRRQLWQDPGFAAYTQFYNVLAKPRGNVLIQHETFRKFHEDWPKRASAPYVLFDRSPALTAINVNSPIHVATKPPTSLLEVWQSDSDRATQIEAAIFGRLGISRRLRTRSRQRPHRHIALHKPPGSANRTPDEVLERLRDELLRLV